MTEGASEIVMYATDWCPYCARARHLLQGKGVGWREIDVDTVPAEGLEAIAGVPRIVVAIKASVASALAIVFPRIVVFSPSRCVGVWALDEPASEPPGAPRVLRGSLGG